MVQQRPSLGFPLAYEEGVSYVAFCLNLQAALELGIIRSLCCSLGFCQLEFAVRYLSETFAIPGYRDVSQTSLQHKHLLLQGS